jgi:hypothetical protein
VGALVDATVVEFAENFELNHFGSVVAVACDDERVILLEGYRVGSGDCEEAVVGFVGV